MKKRIVALILVVVMSIAALTSCGSYNLANEDFRSYTTFNYQAFKDALQKLEIEDATFTTNEETRAKILAAKIYNAIADKIIAATEKGDRNTFGETIDAGDVVYFAYYATYVDGDGNEYEFFRSHMDKDTLTGTSPIKHYIRLADNFDEEKDAFYITLRDAFLQNANSLKPYVTYTKSDLETMYDDEYKADHDGKTYAELDAEYKEKDAKFKENWIKEYKANNNDEEPTVEAVKAAYDAFKETYDKEYKAFQDEYSNGKKDYIKVKEGDILCVSYTVTHKAPIKGEGDFTNNENGDKVDKNGNKVNEDGFILDQDGKVLFTDVTEKVAYKEITKESDPLFSALLNEKAPASIGDNYYKGYVKDNEDGSADTNAEFKVTVDGAEYTYKNVIIRWRVDPHNSTPIDPIEYAPFSSESKYTPDTLYNEDGDKIDLNGKTLKFYIFPVYAISTPTYEKITATDILYHIYGSNLKAEYFDVFEEDYKYVDNSGEEPVEETVKSLIERIAKICVNNDTVKIEDLADNEYYKDSEDENKTDDLVDLLKAYQQAVKDGGSNPTGAKKTAIENAKKALTNAQNVLLKEVIEKIATATNEDGEVLGDKIKNQRTEEDKVIYGGEYYDMVYHSEKETYDAAIVKNVQTAVWKLINDSVTIDYDKIPKKLVKQYMDHLYDSYEYDFYEGNFAEATTTTAAVSNYTQFNGNFNNYLIWKLNLTNKDKLDKKELKAALRAEACEYLDPIIKIYVVAQACNDEASASLVSYVQDEINAGAYSNNTDEEKTTALEDANFFLMDKAFIKFYKKNIGKQSYKRIVASYGEINLLAGKQFNKLFQYLTNLNLEASEDGDHAEAKYVLRDTDGDGVADTNFLSFRNLTYVFPVKAETGNDNNNGNN